MDAPDANLKKSMWRRLFLDISSESRLPRLWYFLHLLTMIVVLLIIYPVIKRGGRILGGIARQTPRMGHRVLLREHRT